MLKQVIQQPNSHVGLVVARRQNPLCRGRLRRCGVRLHQQWQQFRFERQDRLGHTPCPFPATSSTSPNKSGLGLGVAPNVTGLGISADGKTLVAANNYNDSISVIDTASGTVRYEYDLRPFATSGAPAGTKGGTFPFSVVKSKRHDCLCWLPIGSRSRRSQCGQSYRWRTRRSHPA